MMTAELFDAQKALKIGLIDKVDQDAMGFAILALVALGGGLYLLLFLTWRILGAKMLHLFVAPLAKE